ncbi:MFS transporter, partial [Rhizobiaceae sp. 2RAB30]
MHPGSTLDVKLQVEPVNLACRHVALLALLMACGFLVVGQLYVTVPLTAGVAARFGVEPAQAAMVGAAFGIAYAAGFLFFAPLSDHFGRRRMILIGLTATALATTLVGVADSFGALLAARTVQGLVGAIIPPVALSLVTEELPPQYRPLVVSLLFFAFLGAAPLAQLFAVQTGGNLSAIMLKLAPFYLLGALGLFFAVPKKGSPAERGSLKDPRLVTLLDDPAMVAAWAAAITVLFGFVFFHSGAQALGGKTGVDLQMLRLIGLPPLLLTLAAAVVTRRYGASVTARMGLILAALAFAIATIGSSLAMSAASAVLSGGVAFAVPGLVATVAGRATDANRGLALAIYSFALFLGASFAPPAAQILAAIGTLPLWLL